MRGARQRIGIAMQGALPMLHGEVEAGENFEPAEDHSSRGFQGTDPGESVVVSTQNIWPVEKVIFIVLEKEDYRQELSFGGGVVPFPGQKSSCP